MPFPNIFRPKPGSFGVMRTEVDVQVGTGATSIANSATTSVILPVPRRLVQLSSITVNGLVVAVSSGTVTFQVFKRDNQPASPADVTLTNATSLKSDFLTSTQWSFAVPIISTVTVAQRTFQKNDFCRIDLVASGTVSTQPTATITALWDLLE